MDFKYLSGDISSLGKRWLFETNQSMAVVMPNSHDARIWFIRSETKYLESTSVFALPRNPALVQLVTFEISVKSEISHVSISKTEISVSMAVSVDLQKCPMWWFHTAQLCGKNRF